MVSNSAKPLLRGAQIIWYLLLVIESFLLLRFIFKFLGANSQATFTDLVYTVSGIFVAPFQAVFRNSTVVQGSVFEWTTLLAMLIYYFIALGIIKLFVIGKPVSAVEADQKLSAKDLE